MKVRPCYASPKETESIYMLKVRPCSNMKHVQGKPFVVEHELQVKKPLTQNINLDIHK